MAVDTQEMPDTLKEVAEASSDKWYKNMAGVLSILLIALGIVAGFGGGNAEQDVSNNLGEFINAFNFYQAKNIRQSDTRLALDRLEIEYPRFSPMQQGLAQKKMDAYRATIQRYESEPVYDDSGEEDVLKGEGKRELLLRGQYFGQLRERAQRQDDHFDYALLISALGLAAVVAVANLVSWRWLQGLSLIFGAGALFIAAILTINGFYLLWDLPFV